MELLATILSKAPSWVKFVAAVILVSFTMVEGVEWINDTMSTKQTKMREYVDRQDNLHAAESDKRVDDISAQLATLRTEVNNGFSEIRKTQEDILLRLPRSISLNKKKKIYE